MRRACRTGRRQKQLSNVFDLDLWRPPSPGLDEQFDAERFGVWIEVLVEAGVDLAAEKLSQMPVLEQLIPGFAHHARVFEIGAIGAFETTDGELIESRSWSNGLILRAWRISARLQSARMRGTRSLQSFCRYEARRRHRFGELMSALRWLSNSKTPRSNPWDALLDTSGQMMFDVASEREGRREKQGFASPADARAFLQMSQECPSGSCFSSESNRTRVLPLHRHTARRLMKIRRSKDEAACRSGGTINWGRRVAAADAAGSAHRRAR